MIDLGKKPVLSLTKGQPLSLTKAAGRRLSRVAIGLAWDPAPSLLGWFGGGSVDLDASCICLDGWGQVVDQVWFNQLHSRERAIHHSGDNRTGDGGGDDETIRVNLEALDPRIAALVFTITSYTGQTFDRLAGSTCRVYEGEQILAQYALPGKGSHTALVVAGLRRQGDDWEAEALGIPANGRVVHDLVDQASRGMGPWTAQSHRGYTGPAINDRRQP